VKLTAVCGLAALSLGAALLTACGGAAATPSTSAPPSTSTSTSTSAAVPAARTEAELLHLLESAPAPADQVVGTLSSRQIRDELSKFRETSDRYTAKPAGCAGLAFANALDVTKGATAAAISVLPGDSRDLESMGALSMSAISGLDLQALGRARDALADLVDRCPEVALSDGKDGTIQSAGRRISVPARTTGVLAVRVRHVFPSGDTQETALLRALRAGVLLTAQVTARTLSDADLRAAAQMLDRAADQLP